MASADGKGRTLWEILTGNNKKDERSLELQHFNPLNLKISSAVSVDELSLKDVNFLVERISVYETVLAGETFYHTDYHLKGVSLSDRKTLRYRLRYIPIQDGFAIQLLKFYDEMAWDEDFYKNVLCNESALFNVNYDDQGGELEVPWEYSRVDDVGDPYFAKVNILEDIDGNGVVEDDELTIINVTYWDYCRVLFGDYNEDIEYLVVEMNDDSGYFTFLRGKLIASEQVLVV